MKLYKVQCYNVFSSLNINLVSNLHLELGSASWMRSGGNTSGTPPTFVLTT